MNPVFNSTIPRILLNGLRVKSPNHVEIIFTIPIFKKPVMTKPTPIPWMNSIFSSLKNWGHNIPNDNANKKFPIIFNFAEELIKDIISPMISKIKAKIVIV